MFIFSWDAALESRQQGNFLEFGTEVLFIVIKEVSRFIKIREKIVQVKG